MIRIRRGSVIQSGVIPRRSPLGIAVLVRAAVLGGLAVLVLQVGVSSCSSDDTSTGEAGSPTSTLPFSSPSRAEIETATGLAFPDSLADYRSVELDPSELNIAATIALADVADFVSSSELTSATTKRVIAHASPVWDQNPTGSITAYGRESDELRTLVEVVTPTDGDRATVRLVVQAR